MSRSRSSRWASILLVAGGLAFALIGWRVLSLEHADRERLSSQSARQSVARAVADAERLAAAPRGKPGVLWTLEPAVETRGYTTTTDAEHRTVVRMMRAIGNLDHADDAKRAEALADLAALSKVAAPAYVASIAAYHAGVFHGAVLSDRAAARPFLVQAAGAAPTTVLDPAGNWSPGHRVDLAARALLARWDLEAGQTRQVEAFLDAVQHGRALSLDARAGPARLLIDFDEQRPWPREFKQGIGGLVDQAVARATTGREALAATRAAGASNARPGSVVFHDGIAWRGHMRVAIFGLDSLMEEPLPGTPRGARLIIAKPGTVLAPHAKRLRAPLDAIVVEPVAPPATRGFPWWTGAAFALGLLAYGIGAGAAIRGWRRSAEAARQQAHFTAAVSHEMKTPIASVRAMAELLADAPEGEDERTRAYGERIDREMQRLGTTVRNVLDAAHIERGTLTIQRRRQAPDAFLERLAETVQPGLAQRGFTLETRIAPATAEIRIDAAALEGVVLNLIDNAVKFSGDARTVELEGEVRPHGGYRVGVLDRGVGLGDADPAHLFERYARGEAAREGAVPGVGLGLHIARQVVEAHGGMLRARARPGGGAIFDLELPGGPTA